MPVPPPSRRKGPVRKAMRRAAKAKKLLADYLRASTIGGIILLAATVAALICANTGLDNTYFELRDTKVGVDTFNLKLTIGHWAADGLLAIFFFVAGLELKRELVIGELRNPRRAAVPVAAALGGMIMPALVALAVATGAPGGDRAWPIPVATDIAFALAVLAVTASALPPALRVFLLSLAVIDDLGSIILIAVRFTADFTAVPLLAAMILLAGYTLLQQLRIRAAIVYVPLAFATWALIHESGIHPTVAGVMLGLLTRVKRDDNEDDSPAERLEHTLQPVSAGLCVPIFAFFAAGVTIGGDALASFASDRIVWAVITGLVIGKFLGVFGGALAAIGLRIGTLSPDITWPDVAALATLSGCGFTVSLLINELAFGGSEQADRITVAVLVGSLLAALLAATQLRIRVRRHINNANMSA